MIASATGKRFIAAFFLAFFGLNLVGIFCLSHCNLGTVVVAASASSNKGHGSSHCDPKPAAHHEKKVDDGNNDKSSSVSGVEQCCDPGFGIVTALTKSTVDIAHAVTAEPDAHHISHSSAISNDLDQIAPLPVYRPPPKDRRIERKLNCVFVI